MDGLGFLKKYKCKEYKSSKDLYTVWDLYKYISTYLSTAYTYSMYYFVPTLFLLSPFGHGVFSERLF